MATISTVVPGFGPSVSPVWRQSGVMVRRLSSFTGTLRDAADRAGIRSIAIQLANTPDAQANRDELQRLRPELFRRGWQILGWGTFGQGTGARQDGEEARAYSRELSLEGWLANGEAWVEGSQRFKSADFVAGFSVWGTRAVPLALVCESSVTGNYARDLDFQPFMDYYGAAIIPEVYCASDPRFTLPAMRASFRRAAGVRLERVVPCCNVVKGAPLPTRYARWRGPRWVYAGEDTLAEQWPRILVTEGGKR